MKKTAQNTAQRTPQRFIKSISFDITNFDRTTIIWQIRSAYRHGYNAIDLTHKNTETPHLRKTGKLPVRDAIKDQVGKTLGGTVDIIDDHHEIIRIDRPKGDADELLKRLVRNLSEMHAEFLLFAKGHVYASALVEEKHDSITKLVAYCQLLLNDDQSIHARIKYHILAMIDKAADIIKYMNRDYAQAERPMSKTAIAIIQSAHEYLLMYERLYHKYHTGEALQMVVKRDDVKRAMRASLKGLDAREAFLLGQVTCIVELFVDMLESRMSLEVK